MFIKKESGFTLIELLVVIAIIGILSSVVLASLNSARKKSRDARRVGDIKQLQLALEMYYDSNASYPTSTDSTYILPVALKNAGFIPQVPKDPQNTSTYKYTYFSSGDNSSYILKAVLENNNRKILDGTGEGDFSSTGDNGCVNSTGTTYNYCVRP